MTTSSRRSALRVVAVLWAVVSVVTLARLLVAGYDVPTAVVFILAVANLAVAVWDRRRKGR